MGTLRVLFGGLFLLAVVLTDSGSASEPLAQLVPFRRVEADPNKEYVLNESNGPWMIYVAAFAGEGAKRDSQQLVLELRRRHKLPAYTHARRYDYSKTVPGIGLDRFGEPKKMRYQQAGIYDEIGVLVGNYPTVNDREMAGVLNRLKYLDPDCLRLTHGRGSTLRFAGLRALQKRINGNERKRTKGPLGSAFITRNPLLPDEYFAPRGIDELVSSMNKDVHHSLLNCPGKYSVRVATFRGTVIIDQQEVTEIEQSGRMESRLNDAAEKAHLLTEALRKRGVEAYEFHDRHESIVTVGSFDTVGSQRRDGKTEINPAILRIMQMYGPTQRILPGSAGQLAGLMPRQLAGIPFDVQPTPVEVPRRSVAANYASPRKVWK
jgi:hypothetical protein